MRMIDVEIEKQATFAQLELKLNQDIKALGIELGPNSCFAFADVLQDRIYKQFNKGDRMSSIHSCDKVYAIEMELMPGVEPIRHTFVPVSFRRRVYTTYGGSGSSYTYEKCVV